MSIRLKMFIPMIITGLLLSLAGFFIINNRFSELKKSNFEMIISDIMNQINSSIEFSSQMQLEKSSIFSRLPIVVQAYELAHSGNIDDPNDTKAQQARVLLRNELKYHVQGFEEIENAGKMKLHFHLPNGRSLLRIWRAKQKQQNGQWVDISDDISGFRQTVLDVNQLGQSKKGIELGRGGFVIRGVTMVKNSANKILGSVEMLMDFKPLMNNAIANDAGHSASLFLYMNSELLTITTQMNDPSKFPILDNRFVFVYGTGDKNSQSHIRLEHLLSGKEKFCMYQSGEYAMGFFPIRDYRSKQIGVMVYTFNKQSCDKQIMAVNYTIISIIIVIFIVFGIIIYIVFSKFILNPTEQVLFFSKQIAKGDVTARLSINQKDEIGGMSTALNNMAETQSRMLKDINLSIEKLTKASKELTHISIDTSQSTQIAIDKSIRIKKESEQIQLSMESVASSSEQASTNMSNVASATEQMSATINEIASHTDQAKKITSQAVKNSETASSNVSALGNAASLITQFADTITEISEQTNLLALNATIEAARAGEAGKGFTVVANEIKELAKQTANATQEIIKQIETINNATDTSVNQIKQVSSIIQEINQSVTTIAVSIEEQASVTREISSNVNEASVGIKNVANNSAKTLLSSKLFFKETNEISNATNDISLNSDKVKQQADQLNQMSEQLKQLMAHFKL